MIGNALSSAIFGEHRELRNRPAMLRTRLLASTLCLALASLGLLSPAAWGAGEAEFLAGQTKACPNCALEKVSLKRRDLGGADLAGAKLAGAVLHRCRLIGANLIIVSPLVII